MLEIGAPLVFQLATGEPPSDRIVSAYDWVLWGLVLPSVYAPCPYRLGTKLSRP